jgi:hypothetical protein
MHDGTRLSVFVLLAALPVMTPLASAQSEASQGPPTVADQPPETAAAAAEQPGFAADDLPNSDSDVHLSFTPYFWLTSFSGTIGVDGIDVDLDKSVIDILNGSDKVFGLMGAVDVEYKRLVFQLNAAWGTVEGSEEQATFHDGTLEADVDVDGAFSELFAGYRLVDTPLNAAPDSPGRFKLDAYAGGRVTAIKVDMTLHASRTVTLPGGEVLPIGRSKEIEQSGDWFEPFVGLRGIFQLDDHWLIQLRGDVGGFGVEGSEFSWQAAAVVGYQWRLEGWDIALVGGYRALSQDYASGDFEWDVITHGPLLGVSFAWSF